MEIDPNALITDSPTTLMGVNHIGLSVIDLDAALAFYQGVTGFELLRRDRISNSAAADTLFGHSGVEYEIAALKAPNMLFELIAFTHNADAQTRPMPVQGPGMTHTCFQSAANDSGYDKFRAAGARVLSRGDSPIDLGGYGVTYAYAYDHEGNMFELEQLDADPLSAVPNKGRWIEQGHSMWMTQVALVTHDIERLTDWYQTLLGFAPNRKGDFVDHPRMNEVVDHDGLSLKAAWFKMDRVCKTLELWQYRNPLTSEFEGKRLVTGLGYSFSIEVEDIQLEYARLRDLGVEFVSDPVLMESCWQVYGHDIDGNVFALRQWADAESPFSLRKLEV
jgi:catechol 2,3-dioxygenase-like lactoylglutathione lyase family enzyme